MKTKLNIQNLKSFLSHYLWIFSFFMILSSVTMIRPRRQPKENTISEPDFTQKLQKLFPDANAENTQLPRRWLGYALGCSSDIPYLPLPDIDDIIILCYGIPVAPWLKRIGIIQWNNWLDHLGEALRKQYPNNPLIQPGEAWAQWITSHVQFIETHFAHIAAQKIAQILNAMSSKNGAIYLFGHSAGGAAVLDYLADLRSGAAPQPAKPIRAALTLNAAVSGIARSWTAWPTFSERPSKFDRLLPVLQKYVTLNTSWPTVRFALTWSRMYQEFPFRRLGAWAHDHGISVLTVCDSGDIFSHGPLDDVPFHQLNIGSRFDFQNILNGKNHLHIQRDPRVPKYIWWRE